MCEKLTSGRWLCFFILVVTAISALAENQRPTRDAQERDDHYVFEVDGQPTIVVRNVEGQVDVQTGDSNQVEIWIERSNPFIDIDIRRDGNRITIETEYEKPPFCHRDEDWSVNYVIHVPNESDLRIKTVTAGIDVDQVSGDLRLETVTGHISATSVDGDVRLTTVDGNIWLDLITDATVNALTVSGDITDTHGFLNGKSREFSTVAGDIKFVPQSDASFYVFGETLIGDIDNGIGDELDVERNRWTGIKRITGNVNGGEARLRMRSVTGNLTLSWDAY